MGLVTPEIRPYRREGEAGVLRFVAERCPDFVIVFPAWFPEITARRDLLTPVYRVRLERNEVSRGPEMGVDRLPRLSVLCSRGGVRPPGCASPRASGAGPPPRPPRGLTVARPRPPLAPRR